MNDFAASQERVRFLEDLVAQTSKEKDEWIKRAEAAEQKRRAVTVVLLQLSTAVVNMLEQAAKCNFIDDHGHALWTNKTMVDLRRVTEHTVAYGKGLNRPTPTGSK